MAGTRFDINVFLREKLLAALVAAGVYYLQAISTDMRDISRNLAVAINRLDEHDRRLSNQSQRITVLEQARIDDRQASRPR